MLNLLSRLMISRALDEGRPPPAWVARRLERSPGLRRFAAGAARLDRALSATPPPADEPSPFLGARIRAAVEPGPIPHERDRLWSARTVLGVVAATLALAGVFAGVRWLQPSTAIPADRISEGRLSADLFGRIQGASPRSLVAGLQRPILDEAQQFWVETRQVVRVVADRWPSPPTLPR